MPIETIIKIIYTIKDKSPVFTGLSILQEISIYFLNQLNKYYENCNNLLV